MSVGRKWLGMKSKRRQIKTQTRRPFRSARIEALEPRQVLSVPSLVTTLSDVTLYSGSPLLIPLDGFDADGLDVSFTATSSNPSLVETFFTSDTNRSLKIDTNYGEMVLELFEDLVPRATTQIITLAESGFYDGLIFHRVINNFMIQGGDPLGDGTGGSDLPDFDDQFNVDLQHNRSGLLSMAKSGDDTNNSQFFITEVPTRHLDFNHTIFGLLIEGEDVREAISEVDTKLNDSDPDNDGDADAAEPFTDVVMESVEIYYDNQNATLMLKAPEGTSGEADITITIIDHNGTQYVQPSFHVTVQPDVTPGLGPNQVEPLNANPFLPDIGPIYTTVNTEVSFSIAAIDVDGDLVLTDGEGQTETRSEYYFDAAAQLQYLYQQGISGGDIQVLSHDDLYYLIDQATKEVTVTPTNDLVGLHLISVAVTPNYVEYYQVWNPVTEQYEDRYQLLGLDAQVVPIIIQPESISPVSQLDVTIVQTSTVTDQFGEVEQLPQDVDWMDEWESFSVEIWASTLGYNEFGIHTASFDLTYNTDYYTATGIEYGNVFSTERTGTIDDASGIVRNIGGKTPMYVLTPPGEGQYFPSDPDNVEEFGDDKPVLVARVHFQPNATGGGVPVNNENGYMMPVTDLGLSIQNAQVGWNVAETTTVQVAAAPSVNVWPVMYDCDNDGIVGLGDLALFASAYQSNVDPDDPNDPGRVADYDRSGKVGLGDLAFFADNYRKSVLNGDVPTYPFETRDVWLPPAPATSQTMATMATPPAQTPSDESINGGDLYGTVDRSADSEQQLAFAMAQAQQDSQANDHTADTASAIVDLLMRSEMF